MSGLSAQQQDLDPGHVEPGHVTSGGGAAGHMAGGAARASRPVAVLWF